MKVRVSTGRESLRGIARVLGRFLSLMDRLAPFLAPQSRRFGLAGLAAVGYTIVTLIEPWPIQVLFDGVLLSRPVHFLGVDLNAIAGGDRTRLLIGSTLAILIFAAVRGQLYYAQNVLAATAGQDMVMAIRQELFAHLQRLSIAYHRRAQAGDLLMRLTGDIAMLREMIVAVLVSILSQLLVIAGVLTVMAIINPRLTLIAAAVAPVLFLLLVAFRVRLVEASARQRKREGVLASRAHEVLQSVHVVQAYTAERHEDERFREVSKRSHHAGLRSTRLEASLHRNVQIALAGGVAATLAVGARDVLGGTLSPGELLVFMAYVRGLYGPLRQISKATQRAARATACGDRVLQVLDETPEVVDAPDGIALRGVRGAISFRGVTFGYRPDAPVLRDVNLEIAPEETIALVGPTGSGKTTLLDLIPRFFDPIEGEIRLDGVPVRDVRLKSLRRQISYLSQEAVVMGLSLRDNIAYGAIGRRGSPPDQAEIERAAWAARAHEFIVDLPHGYDTIVGERGSTLSGGQRRRIAIARALLRNARILLLDEPMTGLDPLSERAVFEGIENLRRGRTTLVVAHDPGAVLHADRIIFLEGGRVIEQGSHAQLLAQHGPYERFVRSKWGAVDRGRP